MGLRSLKRQRVRSSLTVLGIVIGIAVVVALLAISDATDTWIREEFEKFGAEKIVIMPGSFVAGSYSALSGRPFTEEDVEVISKVSGVRIVAGVSFSSLEVRYRERSVVIPVYGVPTEDFEELFKNVQGYELEEGRYFTKGERRKAVLGYIAAREILETRRGSKIYINNEEFRVVGVLKKTGSRVDDTAVLIPLEDYRELTGRTEYDTVFVEAAGDVEAVAERIKRVLRRERGSEDFVVLTSQQLAQRVSSILGVITMVLLVVAVVSLVVGAVGIMNTMYMSVVERTKEIGILKAIGATKKQILMLFLVESAALSLIGGVLGSLLGYALSYGVSLYLSDLGFDITPSPLIAFQGVLLSLVIGVLAGVMPALRAASLDPIQALRYE